MSDVSERGNRRGRGRLRADGRASRWATELSELTGGTLGTGDEASRVQDLVPKLLVLLRTRGRLEEDAVLQERRDVVEVECLLLVRAHLPDRRLGRRAVARVLRKLHAV